MFIRQTNHEVARGSNLDLILRGFNGAINKLADAVGGGLQAIALALSTPQDNSEEVKVEIERIRALREALQKSVNESKGEN